MTNQYRDKFIRTADFKITKRMYLALTETKKLKLFAKTKIVLDELASVERKTSYMKATLDRNTAIALSEGVIAYSNAAFAQVASIQEEETAKGQTEDIEAIIEEFSDVNEYCYFEKWLSIKTREDESFDIDGLDEAVDEEMETIEYLHEFKEVLKNNSYEERGIVFDYIQEMWNKESLDESDKVKDSVNVASSQVQTLAQIRKKEKEDWNRRNQERMDAYLEHINKSNAVI